MNPVLVKISQEMNFWLTIFFLIPGCLLNILMASIFMKKRFWKNSSNMGYYYTVYVNFNNTKTLSYSLFTFK